MTLQQLRSAADWIPAHAGMDRANTATRLSPHMRG